MKKIRWGLLSTARINSRLIPAIHASKTSELTAIASRDQSVADAYAKTEKIPHAFGSYQAMLDSDVVDVIYISLPNHLHAEWSIRAMQAGKHVLCEKPITISMAEMDAMMAASQQYQRVLAEAFMYRHHPQTRIALEWARNGSLGDIFLIQGIFNFNLNRQEDYRRIPELGGGCLWDVGVYPLSFAQYIYGSPPLSVSADHWIGESGIDESFSGQMRYPGDCVAQISSSFRSPFFNHVEIIGTQGRISLNRPFSAMNAERRMIYFSNEGKPFEIPVPKQELYIGEVEDMHAAIVDGAPPRISLEESRNHVRTVLALYQAARTQQVVLC
jgi:xylose dehydrogenase (NAD/NADP)